MIIKLMLKGLARGKARFACAVAGIAAAGGAVMFMFSLMATNAAQAPALALRATAPWAAWEIQRDSERGQSPSQAAQERPRGPKRGQTPQKRGQSPRSTANADLTLDLVALQLDYRPGGRVLQGPPMRAVVARSPKENPYAATRLVEGRWVNPAAPEFEIVCTQNTLKRFGHGTPPPVGTDIKFVGEQGTMTAKIVGYLAETKLPMGWPGVFANEAAFGALKNETHGRISFYRNMPAEAAGEDGTRFLTAKSETVVAMFKGDEQRRMDYARPLMLVAAVLTALCLLVNSLLLSVESNRRAFAQLRMVGLTRRGVVALVAAESFLATLVGWTLGSLGAKVALDIYVAADPVAFPVGAVSAWTALRVSGLIALVVAFVAVLFALRPALQVRPLDAIDLRTTQRRRGMAVAFACGFAAFVAVEVWGASLMRAFVPSEEWPDAIVSILPEGVSSFDVEKLRKLPGVQRISELCPLQLDFDPPEAMAMPMRVERGGDMPRMGRGNGPRRPMNRNALFLAAEWLPKFKFLEGTWDEAQQAILSSDACVITEMMSRARNLHKGDKLRVALPGRGPRQAVELPIAAVVDLNWHMVTSRGLVRGRNGAPVMTDGPVFVSFDTIESLDARPAAMTKMTHLWVEYDPAFLKEKGVFPAGRALENSIAQALDLASSQSARETHSTVRLHARDEIADGTLAHGSDVIGQAARVPFVFLAILSLGFIAMLVADAEARSREWTVLRAVGATQGQLTRRLAFQAVKTAFWGVLSGLPLGSLAGWLFTFKTGNWPGLPHYFVLPWQVVGEGTLGAFLFVLVLALPTARMIIRRQGRRR
ncbi:MAG: ABC transporter permease [Kiritimatiellae bacterium]|nr:ABC transporter permease [Kiritimatiellia bacterium]